MDKDLRDVVDALICGMTAMEESMNKKFEEVNKRFDEMGDRFDRLEAKVEKIEGDILDVAIIKATVDKHDYDIKRLKNAI